MVWRRICRELSSKVPYPGYPRVADARPAELWFYGLLPGLILLAFWRHARARRLPIHLRSIQGEFS